MSKMETKQNKTQKRGIFNVVFVTAIVAIMVFVFWGVYPDNTEDYDLVLVPSAFIARSSEHDLNVMAPMGPTYYTVQLDSNYIYLGEEYYDLHEIPENRVITVTRNDKHSVRICYWVLESDNYYTLVGMGVYE